MDIDALVLEFVTTKTGLEVDGPVYRQLVLACESIQKGQTSNQALTRLYLSLEPGCVLPGGTMNQIGKFLDEFEGPVVRRRNKLNVLIAYAQVEVEHHIKELERAQVQLGQLLKELDGLK